MFGMPIQIDLDQERQSQTLPGPGTFVEEVLGDLGNELRISPLHTPGSGIIYRDVTQFLKALSHYRTPCSNASPIRK